MSKIRSMRAIRPFNLHFVRCPERERRLDVIGKKGESRPLWNEMPDGSCLFEIGIEWHSTQGAGNRVQGAADKREMRFVMGEAIMT